MQRVTCESEMLYYVWRMKDIVPVSIFAVFMSLIAIGVIVSSLGGCDAEMLAEAFKKYEGGNCFDFWLNRYQTMLAGICTLIGAGVAGYFVYRQTSVAQRQLSVMMGDTPPTIYFQAAKDNFSDFTLRIFNENRQPLDVLAIHVVTPDVFIYLKGPQLIPPIGAADKLTSWPIGRIIGGCRPSAPEAKHMEIEGHLGMFPDRKPATGMLSEVLMRVDYKFVGEPLVERSVTVILAPARIGYSALRAAPVSDYAPDEFFDCHD